MFHFNDLNYVVGQQHFLLGVTFAEELFVAEFGSIAENVNQEVAYAVKEHAVVLVKHVFAEALFKNPVFHLRRRTKQGVVHDFQKDGWVPVLSFLFIEFFWEF